MAEKVTIGNAELWHGDCLEVLPLLPKVQAVITSPPYFNARDYSRFESFAAFSTWCACWVREVFEVLDDGRMACINSSPVIEARLSRNKRSRRWNVPHAITSACEEAGSWFCEDLTWEKPEGAAINRGQRFFVDRHPMQWRANGTTERIVCYQKPTPELNDNLIARKGGQRVPGEYPRGEVWRMNPETHSAHPAPFPLALPLDLAKLYTWPGETILDPFMGSGTAGVACVRLDRKFVGIELDRRYFDIACERIENEQRQCRMAV